MRNNHKLQVMWYDSLRSKWRYLIEPSFASGGGLRIDSSQMPGVQPATRVLTLNIIQPPHARATHMNSADMQLPRSAHLGC